MSVSPLKPMSITIDLSMAYNGWTKEIDSGIIDCLWHRIKIDADIPANSELRILYFADNLESTTNDLKSVTIKGDNRDAYFESIKGRYFTIRIEFSPIKPQPILQKCEIYYLNISPLKPISASINLSLAYNGWTNRINSGITDCLWHRIRIDADIPASSELKILYTADNSESATQNVFKSITFNGSTSSRDAYLESTKGQYFTIRIEFSSTDPKPFLRECTVYYPRLTYMRFLPEIYSEDPVGRDFLERMLSLFESVLERSSETINALPSLFDPQSPHPPISCYDDNSIREWLGWLSQWVSIDLYEQLKTIGNRRYIEFGSKFHRKKGTLDGLAELVTFLVNPQLFLGTQSQGENHIVCRIKEHKNVLFKSWGLDHDDTFLSDQQKGENDCVPFFRKCSRTFNSDTDSANVNSYNDTLHRVWGKNNHSGHFYGCNMICLYIFLPTGSFIVKKEENLLRIIRSYLPVFVDVEVKFVEIIKDTYPPDLQTVKDWFVDKIADLHNDFDPSPKGTYTDQNNIQVLHANLKKQISNEIKYRVYHAGFNRPLDI